MVCAAWIRSVHLDAPRQRDGQRLVSGTADPSMVKQDNSSNGCVDTTGQSSDPFLTVFLRADLDFVGLNFNHGVLFFSV